MAYGFKTGIPVTVESRLRSKPYPCRTIQAIARQSNRVQLDLKKLYTFAERYGPTLKSIRK